MNVKLTRWMFIAIFAILYMIGAVGLGGGNNFFDMLTLIFMMGISAVFGYYFRKLTA